MDEGPLGLDRLVALDQPDSKALWMVSGPVCNRKGEEVFFLLTLSSVHLGSSQLKERTLVDKNASHKTFSILLYVHWKASKDSGQWT